MRFLIAAAALALAGCQTPCPAQTSAAYASTFHCDDGSDLHVNFAAATESVRVEQEGYAALDLPSRVGGAGFRYADRGAELSGRGTTVRWTRPGAAETECRQIQ